jgi:hypothetical protein
MDLDLKQYKFVHIPKTSGKYFIERYGLEYANNHMHVCYNKKYASIPQNWLCYREPEPKMISMIRNPFDWLFSYYSHKNELGWDGANWRHNITSFKQFIVNYCDPDFKWFHPSVGKSFITPVCNDDGHIVCDYLLYYENFYGDIVLYDYRDKYDNEMIDLCNEKFHKENDLFRYDFEDRIKTGDKIFKVEDIKYFDM